MKRYAMILAAIALLPAAALAGEDPPPAPAPPPDPYDTSPQRVVRVRCREENVTNVLDPITLQGGKGYVRFRVLTGYRVDFLYARRPGDIGRSYGRTVSADRVNPPGVYHVALELEKGRWLIGCFPAPFSTREHPPEHYDEIRVVREA